VAASTNKKVLVARFDKAPLQGFVQLPESLAAERLDLLTPDGNLLAVPVSDVKAVCFVRDFETGESWAKQRVFANRPKTSGLWVRLRFRDGDTIEGLLPNNLLLVESFGLSIVPPDPTFQNQRIFVPRSALSAVEVLGVIGSPLRGRAKPAKETEGQLKMFE
jgi:hypothetical protein